MEITSVRASFQHGARFEILETKYGAKVLRVSISRSINDVDTKDVPDGQDIHMTLIEKTKFVEREAMEVLNASKNGDSVVILCKTDAVYDRVLKFLGFTL